VCVFELDCANRNTVKGMWLKACILHLLNGGCLGGIFRSLGWSDRLLLRVTVRCCWISTTRFGTCDLRFKVRYTKYVKVQFIPRREQQDQSVIDVFYRETHNCCSLLLLCPLSSSLLCLHFVSRICAVREVKKERPSVCPFFVTLYQRLSSA
jgi:hypothetical protein